MADANFPLKKLIEEMIEHQEKKVLKLARELVLMEYSVMMVAQVIKK